MAPTTFARGRQGRKEERKGSGGKCEGPSMSQGGERRQRWQLRGSAKFANMRAKAATKAMARERQARREEREGGFGNFVGTLWSQGDEASGDEDQPEPEQGDQPEPEHAEVVLEVMSEYAEWSSAWEMRKLWLLGASLLRQPPR